MAGGEDAVAFACGTGGVEVEVHQLVHVAQDQHIAVELDDAVILLEGEGRQLAPAVVEARVVCVVLGDLGQQVGDVLLRNAAGVEGGVALGGERVGVEGDERVLGAGLLEAVVEGEQASEVGRVCDQRRPHWWGLVELSAGGRRAGRQTLLGGDGAVCGGGSCHGRVQGKV